MIPLRQEIRAILLAHPPLLPRLTWKQIARRLAPRDRMPPERTIQWHVQQIQSLADGAKLSQDEIRMLESESFATVKECAERSGIPARSVYKLIELGALHSLKFGGRRLIREQDLKTLIAITRKESCK